LIRDSKIEQLIGIEEDFWEGYIAPKPRYEEKDVYDKDFGDSDGIDGFIESYEF
jgi:hypothetical protein